MEEKKLVVIVGPTAVGKTAAAIQLANNLNCEIISGDSRQFYHEMNIGTAKPSNEELSSIPHHFINSLHIDEEYNARRFEVEALETIRKLHERFNEVIMVGGSGLFIKAVCEGFDEIPDIDPAIRFELNDRCEKEGLQSLLNELHALDPDYYRSADHYNSQRIIRALEVCIGSGQPFSSFRKGNVQQRPFKIIKLGLQMDREYLYSKIDNRMDIMVKQGLLEEARGLYASRALNALNTVGYKEIFDYLDDSYDWEECVRLLKRNSRRYAKRQLTWFAKDKAIQWFDSGDDQLSAKLLKAVLDS